VLIDRLQKRIADASIIRLIRSYLNAGIMSNGVVAERTSLYTTLQCAHFT